MKTYAFLAKHYTENRRMTKTVKSVLKDSGLTLDGWIVLGHIYDNPGIKAVHISKKLEVSTVYVFNAINLLTHKGWINKKYDRTPPHGIRIYFNKSEEVVYRSIEEKLQERLKKYE